MKRSCVSPAAEDVRMQVRPSRAFYSLLQHPIQSVLPSVCRQYQSSMSPSKQSRRREDDIEAQWPSQKRSIQKRQDPKCDSSPEARMLWSKKCMRSREAAS